MLSTAEVIDDGVLAATIESQPHSICTPAVGEAAVMTRNHGVTVRIGDLIATVFDESARYSSDAAEVARLATEVVARLMARAQRISRQLPPTTSFEGT